MIVHVADVKYIASCSWGKDSTAMVLKLIEKNYPLDEIIFYDTGMEFKSIYSVRDSVLPILKNKGIKYTELKPDNSFLFDMMVRPKKREKQGKLFMAMSGVVNVDGKHLLNREYVTNTQDQTILCMLELHQMKIKDCNILIHINVRLWQNGI